MLVAWLVLTVGVAALVSPSVALAANGECVFEGGPGAPTYEYCKSQDCIEDGGEMVCSEPAIKPMNSDERSDDAKWEYSFTDCNSYEPWSPAWCAAVGGSWSYAGCSGVSGGYLGFHGANDEGLANGASTAFADALYNAPPACAITGTSDTGWGSTGGSCGLSAPVVVNGVATSESKYQNYTIGGSSCSGTLPIVLARTRKVECQSNMLQTMPNGDLLCYVPTKECCAELQEGNPVSLVDGSKIQQELDYRSGGDHPLEFRRYYSNMGFFRRRGAGPQPETLHDYWRHTYDRVLTPVSGNSYVTAILQRQDFAVKYFDASGNEVLNGNGGADHLSFQSGVGWTLTLANGDVEKYDLGARLSSITTRGGLITTIDRDGAARIETVTDHFGKELNFAYDGDDRLVTVTDPAGEDISFTYDDESRLVSVTYQDNTTRTYLYEDDRGTHWLTGIVDENSDRFSTYEYDQIGRVTLSAHAGGAETHTFAHYPNTSYQLTVVTDPLGLSRQHVARYVNGVYKYESVSEYCATCGQIGYTAYDSNGNVESRRNHNLYHTAYTFDSSRNLETSRTEGLYFSTTPPESRTITTTWDSTYRLPDVITEPNRVLDHDYDADGNLTELTITDTATDDERTWSYTYSAIGQLLTADGPRTDVSDETTYTYYPCSSGDECGQLYTVENAAGHTTTFDEYDAHGRPTQITDPNSLVTVIEYDLRGKMTSRAIGGETTTFDYDDAQQLTRQTAPDGSYLEYTYDEAHRLIGVADQDGNRIEYTLDAAGNRTAEEVYDSLSILRRSLSREFDNRGRLIEEHGADDQTWAYEYDNNGNRVAATDPLDRTTTFSYDGLNRLIATVDAASGETTYAYDDQDLLTDVEDPRGVLTSYEHNGWGDLIAQQSPDTGITILIPDEAGNVEERTDARSKTGASSYDALQRLIETDYADQDIEYGYDGGTNQRGRLTSLSDHAGTTSWSYDLHGRVTERSQTINSKTHAVGYTYNAAGQLESMETPSGQVIEYEYTDNRLTAIDVNSESLLHSATYEPFGPVNGWIWGNGSSTSRAFDQDGRLTTITGAYSTTRFWDDAGRITAIEDDDDPSRDRQYEYDDLDRLTLVIPGAIDPPSASVDVSDTSVAPGDTLTVTANNLPPGASWVAFTGTSDPNAMYVGAAVVAASDNEVDFTVPALAGSYEVRLFEGGSFDVLAESSTITVSSPSAPSQPTLVANASGAATSSQVTVRLTGGYGGATDWLALAVAGSANNQYVQWTYVGSGVTTRDWTVTLPSTAGEYVFRLFPNNGYTLAAASGTVKTSSGVPSLPSLSGGSFSLSSTSAAPGDVVSVTVSDIASDTGHWLALSRTSEADTVFREWKSIYIGTDEDTWNVTMPAFAGSYEIRLFDGGGFSRDATSDTITVSAPSAPSSPTVRPSATTAAPGASVTVRLNASSGASTNSLSIAVPGAPAWAASTWEPVGNGVTDRDWTAAMPTTPGTYEFRLVANSGYTLVASSDPVTVTASAPIGVEGGTGGGGGTGMPTYTYDAVGNRLTSTDILGTSLEYEYEEDSNRLLSISGDESRTYSYDAMGNTTGYGAGSFTYNDAGRLVGAGGREYFYNGLGQRVRKKLNSTDSIYYVYDEAGHLLGEYDTDGELIQETVWFGDIPVATLRPDGSEIEIDYVHADHLNTPRVITQSTNNDVRWRWDDQGFGDSAPDEDPESLGAFEYSLRFPGQQFDDETALHYNYFRDYDPAIGRYIESDPIGQFGGVNTYGYVSGDPASGIDPYGLYKVYGNWCGPDWTGGLAKPWNDLTESERETVKPPIDQLDGACRDHDQCYGKCGTDYPCDPSGRSRCFRSCDTALTKQANAIGGFWGSVIGAAIDRPGTRDPGPNAKCCESGTADK